MTPLEARMAELAARFTARAGEERMAIAAALAANDRATLRDRAHKLAGIAGMMGHDAIGRAALALEETVESGGDPAAAARQLTAMLDALAQSVRSS